MNNKRRAKWAALLAGGGTLLQLSQCDPAIRGVVEDGIITLSNGLFTALLQGFLQAATEQTASAVDLVPQFLA